MIALVQRLAAGGLALALLLPLVFIQTLQLPAPLRLMGYELQ
jgi:hypothetical protein